MTGAGPRVLLLLASNSYKAEDFLAAVGDVDLEVTVGSDHEQALAAEAPGSTLALDFDDVAGSVRRILDYHETHPLAAVVAAEDEGTLVAAAAAEALGLRHNPPAAVAAARHKDRMRERLHAAGIPCPAFRSFPAYADPQAVARAAPLPCVVKPVGLSASRGVIRADSRAEVAEAVRRVGRILAAAEAERPGVAQRLLVEAYVPGAEVALEGLLVGGELRPLALLDKPDPLEGPFFEETLFVTPSRLPSEVQGEVAEVTAATAAALGLREGPVHAELRMNEAGIWMIELAPRSIGGLCSRLFRYRSGIALEELILRHALGLPLPELRDVAPAAGVMMLPIPSAGILREVTGLDEAGAVPGIDDVVISVHSGGELVPLPEGHRYLGFLFARGESAEGVEAALREAHARLGFEIEPAEAGAPQ